MPRRGNRRVGVNFQDTFFKPAGIPLRGLGEVAISPAELETLRLRFIEDLDQTTAAKEMNISQSQYQRDIARVMKKITFALINSQAIRIIASTGNP